jgi:arylsulfatase A-like enzyme
MVLKLPASMDLQPPAQSHALVQPTDVMPTILAALGIKTPLPLHYRAPQSAGTFPQDVITSTREIALHGFDLLPLLRGQVDKVRDYACTGHHRQSWAIQNHSWRFQLFVDGSRPRELFDRVADPYDQVNVIDQHRDIADAMELELRRWVADILRT